VSDRSRGRHRGKDRDDGFGETSMVPRASFESYYGRAILKAPAWEDDIAYYFFLGGLSAGASLLAAGADLTGRPALRRGTRVGALGALVAGSFFLIRDLGRPERFLNMLRVFKPTSPMSVGTWILAAYGPAIGTAADRFLVVFSTGSLGPQACRRQHSRPPSRPILLCFCRRPRCPRGTSRPRSCLSSSRAAQPPAPEVSA
jgi:hypothetical protein